MISSAHSPTFLHFTYVTTHSPTLPSHYLRHSSFSNPSVPSPTPQFILHSSFASPTSQVLQLIHLATAHESDLPVDTRYTITAHCVLILKPILHQNGTFPDMGVLSKRYLLCPIYNPQKSVILILKHKTHDISPLCSDIQTYFTSKWYVSGYGCLIKPLSSKSPLQPLEVCNTNSETQPIVFRFSNLFYIEMVRFWIWVPYQNFIY